MSEQLEQFQSVSFETFKLKVFKSPGLKTFRVLEFFQGV